jgi:hypothetical protein
MYGLNTKAKAMKGLLIQKTHRGTILFLLTFKQTKLFLFLTFLGILSWSLIMPVSFGKNLATVQELYQKGDLKGAENAAKRALDTKISRPERAKIFKFLGLIHYLSGNKSAATKAFEQALALDQTLTVQPQESLDPSAIGFFQGIKAKSRRSPSLAKPSSPATAPKAQRSIAGVAPPKKTLLKVVSNVSGAQVTVDGILAGTTNELINVEPGKIEVEVKSPGYNSRKATVPITKDSENTVTLNLEKPKPKAPPPAPVIAQRSPTQRPGAKRAPSRRSPPREEDLFAPTPSDFSVSHSSGKTPRKGGIPPNDLAGDPAAAFEEEAKMGLAPQNAPLTPGMPMAGVSAGGYPQMQQQVPMMSQPQPQPQMMTPGFGMAPPAPVVPAPIVQQQPIYVQPPVIYQAPIYQPQMYYPPPASLSQPAAPPPDPYSSGPLPDPGPPDPSYKSEPSKNKNELTFVTILPFGIGQFSQERYMVAAIFAGGGAALVGYYLYLQNDLDGLNKSLAQANKENCNPQKNEMTEKLRNECNSWNSGQKRDIADNKSQQDLVIIGFLGTGIISSLEAVMWEPDSKGSGGSKKRKNRSRKYKGFSMEFPVSPGDNQNMTGFVDVKPLTWIVDDFGAYQGKVGSQISFGARF